MEGRRSWLPFLAVVLMVAVGVVVVVVKDRVSAPRCASTAKVASPLVAPTRFGDDDRLTTLATAVGRLGPPFGAVRAGVGFDYGQWLHLYGVPGGVLAFTKDNAPLTLLDGETLKPRWSLRPETKRIAWDVIGHRLVLLDLSATARTRIATYDLGTGRQAWCGTLTSKHRDGDPVSTAALVDGDLVTALRAGNRIRYTLLDGATGKQRWQHDVAGTGRADFVGPVPGHQFVAGGVEEYRLAQPDPDAPGGPLIRQLRNRDASTVWSWSADPGEQAHVVGLAYDRTIVTLRNASGTELMALSPSGSELWRIRPRDGAYQATLRADTVLMRTGSSLDGYDVETGKLRWHHDVPTDRTYFPYGFELGQAPSLSRDELLLPTTSSVVVLNLLTGRERVLPLPTDGIRTTYWPYQLVSTDHLIGVVTNTGAVLADRDVGPLG